MKLLTTILIVTNLLSVAFVYAGGGNPSSGINSCIDSSLINPSSACPAFYAPVCGCNGITYGNDCEALANGVTSYTSGECGNGGGTSGDSTYCFTPYFYYTFDSTGQTVSFMYSTYTILPGGILYADSGSVQLGAPVTMPVQASFSLLWDFGDSTASTEINPVHSYSVTVAGQYNVCLTITDSASNCTAQYCEIIYNYQDSCVADFDWFYDPTNDSITFTNTTPGMTDSSVVIWSFGDGAVSGGYATGSTGVSVTEPSYSYDSSGVYIPCLSTYNPNTGCFNMKCDTIEYLRMGTGTATNDKAISNFMIYSNPASDNVFIEFQDGYNNAAITISVIDVTGNMLTKFQLNGSNHPVEWNTQSVANGIYIIRVESGSLSAYKRVSIIH